MGLNKVHNFKQSVYNTTKWKIRKLIKSCSLDSPAYHVFNSSPNINDQE